MGTCGPSKLARQINEQNKKLDELCRANAELRLQLSQKLTEIESIKETTQRDSDEGGSTPRNEVRSLMTTIDTRFSQFEKTLSQLPIHEGIDRNSVPAMNHGARRTLLRGSHGLNGNVLGRKSSSISEKSEHSQTMISKDNINYGLYDDRSSVSKREKNIEELDSIHPSVILNYQDDNSNDLSTQLNQPVKFEKDQLNHLLQSDDDGAESWRDGLSDELSEIRSRVDDVLETIHKDLETLRDMDSPRI